MSNCNEKNKERIEDGKVIIRAEGINFTEFKKQSGVKLDEDAFVQMYNDYAATRVHYYMTVKEFFNP